MNWDYLLDVEMVVVSSVIFFSLLFEATADICYEVNRLINVDL